jgi:hypothetical protein
MKSSISPADMSLVPKALKDTAKKSNRAWYQKLGSLTNKTEFGVSERQACKAKL